MADSFKKTDFAKIRASMERALLAVEAEFGIKFDVGNIKFTESTFVATVSAAKKSDNPYLDGVPAKYMNDLTKYINYRDALGKEITTGGKKFVVVGRYGQSFVGKPAGQPNGKLLKLVDRDGSIADQLEGNVAGSLTIVGRP